MTQRRGALVVAGIAAALCLLEIGLRLAAPLATVPDALYTLHRSDPELGWTGMPNARRRFRRLDFDTVVEHDAGGWRRPDPHPPADAARRVLVLGDSFTWGWGVGQGELFSDVLQRQLGRSAAVTNRGVTAYGTAQEYLLMRRELAARAYDDVLLLFFPNDLADNLDGESGRRPLFTVEDDRLVFPAEPARPLMGPTNRFLKAHSRVYLFLYDRVRTMMRSSPGGRPEPADATGPAIDFRHLPAYPVTAALLAAMADLATQHGARLSIVYVPDPSQVDDASGPPSPHAGAARALLADVCAREDLLLIDLTPYFAERARQGARLIHPSDGHWTPAGHRLAAEILARSEIFAAASSTSTR